MKQPELVDCWRLYCGIWQFRRLKHTPALWLSSSILGVSPSEMKHIPTRLLKEWILIISQPGDSRVSTHTETDVQTAVYSHGVTLLSKEKEQMTNIQHNAAESQKHHTWERSQTEKSRDHCTYHRIPFLWHSKIDKMNICKKGKYLLKKKDTLW